MTRSPLPLLLALCAVLVAGGPATSQYPPNDPRFEKDPRQEADPRTEKDPRAEAHAEEHERHVDPGEEDLETRELFALLLETGRDEELSTAMGERPWEVLDTVDACIQDWLRLVERSSTALDPALQAEADRLAEKCRRLALLADRGIGDSNFSGWVAALQKWTPEERSLFREREQLLDEAVTLLQAAESEEEYLNALTPLERSLERARRLGDVRGEAAALSTIGRIQALNEMRESARITMGETVRLGRLVRDLDSTWDGLSVIYEVAMLEREFDTARDVLRDQYQISLELGDDETSAVLLERLINLDNLISGDPTTVWTGPRRNPWATLRR